MSDSTREWSAIQGVELVEMKGYFEGYAITPTPTYMLVLYVFVGKYKTTVTS